MRHLPIFGVLFTLLASIAVIGCAGTDLKQQAHGQGQTWLQVQTLVLQAVSTTAVPQDIKTELAQSQHAANAAETKYLSAVASGATAVDAYKAAFDGLVAQMNSILSALETAKLFKPADVSQVGAVPAIDPAKLDGMIMHAANG